MMHHQLLLTKKALFFSIPFVFSFTTCMALNKTSAEGDDDFSYESHRATAQPGAADGGGEGPSGDNPVTRSATPNSVEGSKISEEDQAYHFLKTAAEQLEICEDDFCLLSQCQPGQAALQYFKSGSYHEAIVSMLPLWYDSRSPVDQALFEESYILAFLCHKGKSIASKGEFESIVLHQHKRNNEKIYMALALDHLASISCSNIRKGAAQRFALELYGEAFNIATTNNRSNQTTLLERILQAGSIEERLSAAGRYLYPRLFLRLEEGGGWSLKQPDGSWRRVRWTPRSLSQVPREARK